MPSTRSTVRPLSWRAVPVIGVLTVLAITWWVVPVPPPAAQAPPAEGTQGPRVGAQATLSASVVQAMVAGNAALTRGTPFDVGQARAAFEQALALDERYAPAHAAMAQTLVRLVEIGVEPPPPALTKAVEHGDRAVELDPGGARGWSALARAEVLWTRDWVRAEAHFRRAIGLDPRAEEPAGGLAQLLAAQGRHPEAADQSLKALAVNGKSPFLLTSAGIVRYCAGDYTEALDQFGQALAAGADPATAGIWMARTRAALGLPDALDVAQKAATATGVTSWVVGYIHALAGRRTEAEAVLAAMRAESARRYVSPLEVAYVRAALGDRDDALAGVSTGVRDHSPGSELLLVDPILSSLRAEPAFQRALVEMRARPVP